MSEPTNPARRAAEKIRSLAEVAGTFEETRRNEEDLFCAIIADEYADLEKLIIAAKHLLLGVVNPEASDGGPTSWTETRERWLEHAERILGSSEGTIQVGESARDTTDTEEMSNCHKGIRLEADPEWCLPHDDTEELMKEKG